MYFYVNKDNSKQQAFLRLLRAFCSNDLSFKLPLNDEYYRQYVALYIALEILQGQTTWGNIIAQ